MDSGGLTAANRPCLEGVGYGHGVRRPDSSYAPSEEEDTNHRCGTVPGSHRLR